jgi:hypothetical protein
MASVKNPKFPPDDNKSEKILNPMTMMRTSKI